jgi:predicted nucleic acid-binding protein
MRVLLDTNLLLDLVLRREPWFTQEAEFRQAIDDGRITGLMCASAVTDVFYIVRRASGLAVAHSTVRACLDSFEIVAVDRHILESAAALPGNDFEDNVQIACAATARVDAIVTRDPSGFRQPAIPALTPAEALERLGRGT